MGWKTYCFTVPLLPTWFVVTDPTSLEHVLKTDMHNWVKGGNFCAIFGPMLGHGIFTSDGRHWLWQRKLATHIFSVKGFKCYIDQVFAEYMDILSATAARAAATHTQLDLHDLMYRFTLDSFGKIGFGVQLGCLSSSEAKLPFAAAFDQAQVICVERLTSPGWRLTELLNGKRTTLNACCAVIHDFATDIIQQRRQLLADHDSALSRAAVSPAGPDAGAGTASPATGAADAAADMSVKGQGADGGAQDLLSLFMKSKNADGQLLSDKQLVDTVINFIIAGRDTTAQAVSWTLYELLQHPEVEQQLLQELHEVLGALPAGSSSRQAVHPSYEQIRQLRFTRACFLEALRLHPSVPENIKYAVRAGTLPDGSFIPAGGQLLYSPYVVNRSKTFWGADAEAVTLVGAPQHALAYSYLSFHAGPRLCLGQRLAEIEGVYVLAGLLARFKFSQVQPGARVGYVFSTSLPMKQGLLVTVEERK
ncbi:cytochrome P450 [Scenedesmus sp. NREL 46B-D3]|nr:cytochrome P450 [Scenedesmus sp. NREL 46B-D3]